MSDIRVIDLLGEDDVVGLLASAAAQQGLAQDKDKAKETIRGWRRRGQVSGKWCLHLWQVCEKRNITVTPDDFRAHERVAV